MNFQRQRQVVIKYAPWLFLIATVDYHTALVISFTAVAVCSSALCAYFGVYWPLELAIPCLHLAAQARTVIVQQQQY